MRSSHLIKSARLDKAEERWVLQPCGGDLAQYQAIRAALRRLPWKSESSQQQRTGEYYPTHIQDSGPAPFSLGGQNSLNRPEPAYETPPTPNMVEGADMPDVLYTGEEESDDDGDFFEF